MQVLILEDDPAFQAQLAQAMMAKGFNVLGVETVPAAEAFLRLDMADVLVFGERIGGRLAHPVALLAECRNPLVAAVLLTDRTGPDLDELFDLMPALVGILGRRVAPAVVTQVVMSAVAEMASDSVRNRIATRWAAAERAGGVDTAAPPARLRPASTTWAPVAGDSAPALTAGLLSQGAAFALSDMPAVLLPSVTETTALAAPLAALAPTVTAASVTPASDHPAEPVLAEQTSVTNAIRDVDACAAEPAADIRASAPLPPPRLAKPSPDSPLARLLAAGQRAASPPPAARTPTAGPLSGQPHGALPSWLTLPQSAPAAPVPPAALPWQRPAQPGERRLHLA